MQLENIGRFIQALRVERGLTQKELAAKIAVTDKAVSRWETGRGMPDSATLIPLACALGVTVNELLQGERLQAEQFVEKADDNLTYAFKQVEKSKSNTKKVAIFACIIIATMLILNMIFLSINDMATGVEKPNIDNPTSFSTAYEKIIKNQYGMSDDVAHAPVQLEIYSVGGGSSGDGWLEITLRNGENIANNVQTEYRVDFDDRKIKTTIEGFEYENDVYMEYEDVAGYFSKLEEINLKDIIEYQNGDNAELRMLAFDFSLWDVKTVNDLKSLNPAENAKFLFIDNEKVVNLQSANETQANSLLKGNLALVKIYINKNNPEQPYENQVYYIFLQK